MWFSKKKTVEVPQPEPVVVPKWAEPTNEPYTLYPKDKYSAYPEIIPDYTNHFTVRILPRQGEGVLEEHTGVAGIVAATAAAQQAMSKYKKEQ